MKKYITILALFISVFAQAQPKDFYSLSFGLSAPVGKFSEHNINDFFLYNPDFASTFTVQNINPGFARNGFQVAGDGVFYFSDFLGMSLSFSYSQNSFYSAPFNNDFNNTQILTSGSITGTFTAQPYTHFCVFVGPVVGFEASDKVTLDFRLMVGVLTSSYPTQDIVQQNKDSTSVQALYSHLHIDAPSSSALCVSLGSIIRYKLTKDFSLLMKSEFYWTSQTYQMALVETDKYANSSRDGTSPEYTFTFNQTLTLFNFGFGVGYTF